MKMMHVKPADALIEVKGIGSISGAVTVERFKELCELVPSLKDQFEEVDIPEPKSAKGLRASDKDAE